MRYFMFLFVFSCLKTLLSAQLQSAVDTIVIQTTRIPVKANETGRNITVIRGEEIREMAVTSLDDFFQYIPGIEVQSRNAFGVQGDIAMRGSTFSQVLILVDGMKINDPLTAHFNSYIPVSLIEIDRIEVLRGAASALYGADAVGGVINIITRSFQSGKEKRLSGEGLVNYGEHQLVHVQQGFSTGNNKSFVGGGFSMNQSDGETIPEKVVNGTILESYDNYFDLKTFGLSYGYRFNDVWHLKTRTAYDDRDFSARYFYTSSPLDKSVETTQNWWNQITLGRTGAECQTDFKLAYRYGTDRFEFSPDFPSTNLHSTQLWNFNINHNRFLSEKFTLNFGGQLDRRTIESTDRGDHKDWHYGIYAMGVFRPDSKLSLTASTRLDYDENYGYEVTPHVNVSYVAGDLLVRASAGRSIRASDYTERYVSFNLANLTPGRNLGNPDLMAESSWSEEFGLDYFISPFWQLKATAFFRQSSNLIDYVLTNESEIPNNQNLQTGADYFYATNITDVHTNGIEFESWISKSLNENLNMSWSLGYSFVDSFNEDDVISVYISSHAEHLFTGNLILKTEKMDLAVNGLYVQRAERESEAINARLSPGYQVWNVRLGYRINSQAGLNFQVHNVFNEDYQDILGAQMPGRWMMGGVRLIL